MQSLPKAIMRLSGLKTLYVRNCHSLGDKELAHLPASATIVREAAPLALAH